MKVLGITLAKGTSRGVPNKNLREIAGKPLIQWTAEQTRKSKKLNWHYTSTDSADIFVALDRLDFPVVLRPPELALDDTPSLDVILYHLAQEDRRPSKPRWDAVALIPCTTPLRTAEDIDGAIQMLENNPLADSVIGVTECIPIERVKKIVDGLIVDTYPEPQDGQRQNLEKCYTRSGIYVVRRDSLDKLFGHKTSLAYVLPRERAVNIDDPVDWVLAEALLKEREGL